MPNPVAFKQLEIERVMRAAAKTVKKFGVCAVARLPNGHEVIFTPVIPANHSLSAVDLNQNANPLMIEGDLAQDGEENFDEE